MALRILKQVSAQRGPVGTQAFPDMCTPAQVMEEKISGTNVEVARVTSEGFHVLSVEETAAALEML